MLSWFLLYCLGTVDTQETDYHDCPPYELKDVNWPLTGDVEEDDKMHNCLPSNDIVSRMHRDSKETVSFRFITLARAHIGGLAFSEYAFPGYERREKLLDRAITRTSNIVKVHEAFENAELTAASKELVSYFLNDFISSLLTCLRSDYSLRR